MMIFFHPNHLGESLLTYAVIVVLTGIVCGIITLVEARRQKRRESGAEKTKNSKLTDKPG